MTYTELIENLLYNSNTYLAPSKVCDGVGVFALRPIPKDFKLFVDVPKDIHQIFWEDLDGFDNRLVKRLKILCNSNDRGIFLPSSLNNFNFSFFVNHSDTPNTFHNLMNNEYVTTSIINEGDEILCKYNDDEIDW